MSDEESADLLRRADALLARHRPPARAVDPVQSAAPDGGDIPTLTDMVIDESASSATQETPASPAQITPDVEEPAVADAPGAGVQPGSAQAHAGPEPTAPEVEVISRVQAQNLEHANYLKSRKELDEQIAGIVHGRFMPEVGAVLDDAISKISRELNSSIASIVRASVEETLRRELGERRLVLEDKRPAAQEASGTQPAQSERAAESAPKAPLPPEDVSHDIPLQDTFAAAAAPDEVFLRDTPAEDASPEEVVLQRAATAETTSRPVRLHRSARMPDGTSSSGTTAA